MDYYRRAAAVFILFLTLTLPFVLEQSQETAVVDLEKLLAESEYLTEVKTEVRARENSAQADIEELEAEIMKLVRKTAAQVGAENNYSSILLKEAVYQGGRDITMEVAAEIDADN